MMLHGVPPLPRAHSSVTVAVSLPFPSLLAGIPIVSFLCAPWSIGHILFLEQNVYYIKAELLYQVPRLLDRCPSQDSLRLRTRSVWWMTHLEQALR